MGLEWALDGDVLDLMDAEEGDGVQVAVAAGVDARGGGGGACILGDG